MAIFSYRPDRDGNWNFFIQGQNGANNEYGWDLFIQPPSGNPGNVNPDGTGDGIPGPGDDAYILGSLQVTIDGPDPVRNAPDSVANLFLSATATLSVNSGGSLTVAHEIDNSNGDPQPAGGTITVDNSTLSIGADAGATIVNDGSITLKNTAHLALGDNDVLLTGIGTLFLNDRFSSIYGNSPGVPPTLVNESTISGIGAIGSRDPNATDQQLFIDNRSGAVIDASGFNAGDTLILHEGDGDPARNPILNAGTLEATNSGTLAIDSTTVDQSSGMGVIQAVGQGAIVFLNDLTVIGGTLHTQSGGVIDAGGASNSLQITDTLDGLSAGAITNSADISVGSEDTLIVRGTIDNTGTISILAPGNVNEAVLALEGDVTFTGPDTQVVGGDGGIKLTSSVAGGGAGAIIRALDPVPTTLHNVNNTILGSGLIGGDNSTLILDNEKTGDILGVTADTLTLETMAPVQNAGHIEAIDGGSVTILNTTVDQSAGGLIRTLSTDAKIVLNGGVVIGGTLDGDSGQGVETASGDSQGAGQLDNVLDGSTAGGAVSNAGLFTLLDSTSLHLKGAIVNSGSFAMGQAARIEVGDTGATLTGGGTIAMGSMSPDSGYTDMLSGTVSDTPATLHNVDNTITGAGVIGSNTNIADSHYQLILDNQAGGSVDATDNAGAQLEIIAANPVTNAGVLEDTGTAGLLILQTTIEQSGSGIIKAVGQGAHVDLQNATVVGGTVAGLQGGVVDPLGFADSYNILDGSTAVGAISVQGTLSLSISTSLTLKGAIANSGTILLDSGGQAFLQIAAGDVTLTGGGKIMLKAEGAGADNEITASAQTPTTTLHNVDNTISGAGTIGLGLFGGTASTLWLDNQVGGTIDATENDVAHGGTSLQLVIDTGINGHTTTNAGLIEATGSAGLLIQDTRVLDQGGTLLAAAGSHVDLNNSVIHGGTLNAPGNGYFQVLGTDTTLTGIDTEGGALTNNGRVVVGDNATLSLVGTIHNAGTFDIDGTTNGARLNIASVLDGGGKITLSDSAGNFVAGGIDNVFNTISGAGTIGAGMHNEAGGLIDAVYADNALVLSPTAGGNSGTAAIITNDGVLEANGGKLLVPDVVAGTGHAIITNGGAIQFGADFQQNVDFQGGTGAGTLQLADAYTGTVSGFDINDKIDLSFVSWTADDHLYFSENAGNTGGTLSVLDAADHTIATLNLAGQYSTGLFAIGDDGQGHVQISGVPFHPVEASDFNGNGTSDVLFAGPSGLAGLNFDYEWQMNDRAIPAQGGVEVYSPLTPTDWVQVTGDFNADGHADIVLEDPTTAGVYEWRLNGSLDANAPRIASEGSVDVGSAAYHLLGSADVNGDGISDLIWNNDTGSVYEWQMQSQASTVGSDKPVAVDQGDAQNPALLPAGWHIVGSGDFDGDGKADLLLRDGSNDATNGAFYVWELDGEHIVHQGGLAGPATSEWATLGTGDFNGDGKTDIAIQNIDSNSPDYGAVWVYLVDASGTNLADGTAVIGGGGAGKFDPAALHLVGVGDLNGDGNDDMLFRNDAGYFYSWDMNGATIQSEGLAGTEAGNWADPSLHVVTQHWDLV